MSTEVLMATIPSCDFCDEEAVYDGRMAHRSSWAYFCENHWRTTGIGRLGTGYGQRLVLAGEEV